MSGWLLSHPAGALGRQPLFTVAARTVAARTVAGSARAPEHSPTPQHPPDAVDAAHAAVWELVTRAQDGDGEAFGELFLRYKDTVYRYIYYRVGDQAMAEDFTSETFLRALRRIGAITYQGRDIGAWLVTIARNIVLDHAKSARHRMEVSTAHTIERADAGPGPEDRALATLSTEQLMRAVNHLSDDQRECVLLRFVGGMSVRETAEIMGRNSGAVKALQHRAIRRLATLVAGVQ